MALPTRTVTGTIADLIDQDGIPGAYLTFTPSTTVRDTAGNVELLAVPKRVAVDSDGAWTVDLPVNDAAGATQGFTYAVDVVTGKRGPKSETVTVPTRHVAITSALVSPVAWTSLVPVGSVVPPETQTLAEALQGYVTEVDASATYTSFLKPLGGGADDLAQINAALAEASAFGVKRRVVLRGDFTVTGMVVGESNTVLDGYDAKITLAGATNVDVVQFRGKSNVQILGLEIDGGKATKTSATNTGRGIHLYQCSNALIADCYVHDTYEHGIRVGGDSFQDTADSLNVVIRDNVVKDCGNAANDRGYGIWIFWRVKDFTVHSNIVSGCQSGGIMVDDASSDATAGKECERFTVTNNIVSGSLSAVSRAITVEGCRDFTVTSNVITGHYQGVVLNDGQGGADTGRGTISDNSIVCTKIGVTVADSRDIAVTGNYVEITDATSVAHAAVKVENGGTGQTCRRIKVSGNVIRSNGSGVSTRMASTAVAGMTDVTVSDNDITYSGAGAPISAHVGVQFYAVAKGAVRGNAVRGFHVGIYTDTASATPIVQGNQVEGSATYGIRSATAATLVTHNVTRTNATSGLLFDAAARVASTYVWGNVCVDTTPISGTTTGPTYGSNSFAA